MKILLPQEILTHKYKRHLDANIHPEDPNLRITKCGIRYLYGGQVKSKGKYPSCEECFEEQK